MMHRTARIGLLAVFSLALVGCRGAPAARTVPGSAPEVAEVFVDVTTVRVPEERAEQVLGALRSGSAHGPRPLSEQEKERLLAAMQSDPRVRVLGAPKLLALDRQQATIFIGESIRFSKTDARVNERGGLEFSIEEDEQSPVDIGYHMRLVPTVAPDGKRIALDLHETWRQEKAGFTGEDRAQMGAAAFLRDAVYEQTRDMSFEVANRGPVLLGTTEVFEDADGRHLRVSVLRAEILTEAEAVRQEIR